MNRYQVLPSQPGLSLSQILQEAQHRWLRPIEVCEILNNFRRFKLEEEAPQKPQGGSVFLFDRKALRYFRKDGHNWRKKKDGKTVREAHERLKAGSKEVLHCYYAHGEDNEHFQRRSYWMLDRDLEHIVFVHYREVKEGNRAGTMHSLNGYFVDLPSQIQEMQGILSTSPESSPLFSPQDPSSNTSEQTARMFSSQFDDCDSSDGTEQCLPPALDLPSDRYQEGTSSRVFKTSTAFSTENMSDGQIDLLNPALGCSQPTVLPQDGGPTLIEAREFTSIQVKENQGKNDAFNRENPYSRLPLSLPAGFDSLEWNEPFKETAGSFAGLERQEVTHLLDQYSAPYQSNPLDIGFLDLKLQRPMRPTHNSMGGLFLSELQNETSTESAMKTQHRDLLHSESLKVQTKKNSSAVSLGQIQSEDVTCGHNGSSVLGYEKLMWTQGAESQFNLPQDYLQQLDVTKQQASQKQPPLLQNETSRFNASSTKDVSHSLVYSQVFKDFQADSSFVQEEQEHLKKLDSFGRWINQEIAAGNESPLLTVLPDSTSNWRSAFNGKVTIDEAGLSQDMQLDVGLSLSLFQGQCFSIMEFSPDHAPSSDETKILVTGLFLETGTNLTQGKWCCMFGDVEVPAELLCPGVFKTKAPPHAPGTVSLYITQGDRTACSNIREFHYHADSKTYFNDTTSAEDTKSKRHQEDMLLQIRLSRLLLSHKVETSNLVANSSEMSPSREKHNSAIMSIQDDWAQLEGFLSCGSSLSLLNVKDQLLQKFMKEKLQELLLCNALEGGGSILDDHGLGILHMGAALGYEWAIAPLLSRGLNVNFRDAHGWTALHWAAFCGREKTVVALLAAGADPGAKADPTSDFPAGQTPADLAASCRHKGIAGYLAESSLTNHLSLLNIQECKMDNFSAALADQKAVQTISERTSVKLGLSEPNDQHSLQDSLAAVRNATQAAARIQATFRAISFQRRQEADKEEEDEYGISGNQLLSIIAAKKPHKSIQGSGEEELQSAAVCIQQKFRGWKGRKEFLLFRQHVVKIQAHVRGNQVRSQYKKIIWSVGIVEKAILRWRRKGKGLRGFCKETPLSIRDGDSAVDSDGDEDFLKAGRKQIEAGLEKALARVRSMVKSPEARDQYRRLLDDFQKEKVRFGGGHSCDDKVLSKELATKEDSEMFIKET